MTEAEKEEIKPYATFVGVMKRIQPRLLTIEVGEIEKAWITLLLKSDTYLWLLKAIDKDKQAFRRLLVFEVDGKGYVTGIKVREVRKRQ